MTAARIFSKCLLLYGGRAEARERERESEGETGRSPCQQLYMFVFRILYAGTRHP